MIQKLFVTLFIMFLSCPLLAQEESEVLAKRNNGVITHHEFDAWMSRIPEKDHATFLRDSRRLEQVLSQMLTVEQMAADAREAGFDQDPVIGRRMQFAADNELAKAWTEHVVREAISPDFEALAYESYLLRAGEFMTERSIDVTHLLVSTEDRSDAEALQLATAYREEIDQGVADLETLIMQHSDDPSASSNQGHYEKVVQGDMVEPFEKRAFSLGIDEISEPVKTEFGYHLIRLNAVHKSELKPFESVKGQLVTEEIAKHEKRVRVDYLNQIGSYETQISEDALAEMLSRYFKSDALIISEGEKSE